MSRSALHRLADIREGIERVQAYVEGMDGAGFYADRKTQDAVARQMEIIGEAVKGIPDPLRELEPAVPWRMIAGLRDVLSHAYFAVEWSVVWDAVQNDLPELQRACERLMEGEKKREAGS